MPTPEQIQEMNENIARRQRAINKVLEYNPNEDQKLQIWGSYVPDRKVGPAFKLHPRQSQAVSAARYNNGAVYFYAAGRWQLEEIWVDGMELYR